MCNSNWTSLRSKADYRAAGVDIDAGNIVKARMGPIVRSTFGPRVLTDVGPAAGFGGLFALGAGHTDPVLVASADGVGTKLKIAFLLHRHNTVGIDLVNHCINDILTMGAKPLFFLDYFATGAIEPSTVLDVIDGIASGCREAGCALLGGETAQMPDFYAPGEYDLAGFIVGVVERADLIDSGRVKPGDVLIGLPSSGLHTNGYSLARRVLSVDGVLTRARLDEYFPELGRTLGEELLAPHRSYLADVRPRLDRVTALAHITGGGLLDNLPRALPPGVSARLSRRSWVEPPIFGLIQHRGDIADGEMDRAFNRGIGMILVAADEFADGLVREIGGATIVGEVIADDGEPRVRVDP
ncbi:MAG: phosphoribosylformylglycinamidine cyclo-ligase [Chloroflexota bacterium]|nr:MAG: phosphoribosylformylglycinamidine cyclo-ligase [Chloroflexota bacterium]